MKKRIFLFSALLTSVVGSGVFQSCKDYEEDDFTELKLQNHEVISDLQDSIKALMDTVVILQKAIDGVDGAKGDKGDKGDTGDKGDKGDTGKSAFEVWKESTYASDLDNDGDIDEADMLLWMKGTNGAKGDKGDKGDTGDKGDKGDTGKSAFDLWKESANAVDEDADGEITLADMFLWMKGEPGVQGAQGDKGDKGDQGDKGDKGDQGDKGDKGDQGDKGDKGDQGDSAYDVWYKYMTDNNILSDLNGDGTTDQLDFFLYLKGDKGEDGTVAAGDSCGCDTAAYNNAVRVVNRITSALIGTNGNLTSSQLDEFEKTVSDAYQSLLQAIEDIKDIKDALAKMVTGVIIQQTKNPVFGTFNTPFGVSSNVLMSYYGRADYFNFPKDARFLTDAQYNVLTNNGLSIDSYEHTATGGITVDGQGNAGTLYLTVNPNTVDFTSLNVTLVNSLDEESPCKLQPLEKDSTTKLNFGYTRGANNGFYSAVASFDADAVAAGGTTLNIDQSEIKEAVKDIISYEDGFNLSNISTTLYKAANNICDAEAVKVSWSDSLGEHAVYSKYELAAVAAKPLSFKTFSGFNYQTVPGYERASKVLDEILDKINGIDDNVDSMFSGLTSGLNLNISIDSIDLGIDVSKLVALLDTTTIPTVQLEDLSDDLLAQFNITDTIVMQVDTTILKENSVHHDGYHVNFDDLNTELKKVISSISFSTQIPIRDESGNLVLDGTGQVQFKDSLITLDGNSISDIQMDPIDIQNIQFTITVEYIYHKDLRPAITDLYNKMAGSVTQVNGALGTLDDFLSEIKTFLQTMDNVEGKINESLGSVTGDLSTQLDSALNTVKNKVKNTITSYQTSAANLVTRLQNYLDKVNNKAVSIVNKANVVMQPTMVIDTDKGAKLCSSSRNLPTVVSGNVMLYPTSYNAEVLAPAFKKYVVVTNVYKADNLKANVNSGDADCVSELKRINGHEALNTVLPGYTRAIGNVELKPGFEYAISYLAVDFHGEGANKTFYVKVK